MESYTKLAHKWLWKALFLAITITFTFFPTATAQSDDPQLTVVGAAVSVRQGPGMTYPALEYLLESAQVPVIGYDASSNWWQVELPDGTSGWVNGRAYYVSVTGDTTKFTEPEAIQVETTNNPPSAIHNSPSGTIVFQTHAGGDIYAINGDGTNLRYLTTGMDPAVSPNGRQVAFTRWEGDRDGVYGNIWLINIDGTGERLIHEQVLNPRAPMWSPDGTKLVIGWQQGGHPDPYQECGKRPPRGAYDIDMDIEEDGDIIFCYTVPADPQWSLRLIDVATGGHEDLLSATYSFSPVFHPADGSYVLYDGDDKFAPDEGLTGLNLETNETWYVTTDANDHSPVFSPDGSKIAVSYRQHLHWEVHVMNADGTNRQRLTETSYITLVEQILRGEETHSFNNTAPAWSPDGSQIAFVTDRTGQWKIWVMNADGSNQRPLFDTAVQNQIAALGLQYNGVDERMLSWSE